MSTDGIACLLRRTWEPGRLLAEHPPILRHPHKELAFALACPRGARHRGPLTVTRWRAARVPGALPAAAPEVIAEAGHFDYAGASEGVWHVNFADPRLFAAYGSALLAQDELQVVEHPALASVREALLAAGDAALTEDAVGPTPFLVAGVERRCALDTAPSAQRPLGLYGNRFAAAPARIVRDALRVLDPPTLTNLVAIAAPAGGSGPYWRPQLERILLTAYTGFRAAVLESAREWPGAPVEIRTGFWGCGAFGGNRRAMTLLQVLAARLAGVDRVRFYAFDAAGEADLRGGLADLDAVTRAGGALADVLDRVEDLDYEWGIGDGT